MGWPLTHAARCIGRPGRRSLRCSAGAHMTLLLLSGARLPEREFDLRVDAPRPPLAYLGILSTLIASSAGLLHRLCTRVPRHPECPCPGSRLTPWCYSRNAALSSTRIAEGLTVVTDVLSQDQDPCWRSATRIRSQRESTQRRRD